MTPSVHVDPRRAVELQDYLLVVRKRWRVILLVVLICVGLASAATLEGRFPAGTTVVVPGAQHPSMSLGVCIAAFEAEFIETLEVPDTPPCGDH